MHFGETDVLCPNNGTGFNSHIHINKTTYNNRKNDYTWINAVGGNELIAYDLPPMFQQIWNKNTVPIFLLVIFPLISLRSVNFFTKINCIGKQNYHNINRS